MDEFIKLVTELQLSQVKYKSLDRDENGRVDLSYDKFVDLLFSIRSWNIFKIFSKYSNTHHTQ